MLIPLTEPTTPLPNFGSVGDASKNVHHNRSRLAAIHLPPHGLFGGLAEIKSRRSHDVTWLYHNNKNKNKNRDIKISSKPRTNERFFHSSPSSPRCHASRFSSLRKSRRLSAGLMHNPANAKVISKDFLRTFSRAVVKEKGGALSLAPQKIPTTATTSIETGIPSSEPITVKSEPGSERHVDLSHQFYQSLPLPSENCLLTPRIGPRTGPPKNLRVRQEYDFMKFLNAAEGNGTVFQKDYTSIFETEASTPRSREEVYIHSDSGHNFQDLHADFERAILQSRQAIAGMDPQSSGGPLHRSIGAGHDETYRRPIMEYDDQQASLGFSSQSIDKRAKPALSRSMVDSPFFLRRRSVEPLEEQTLIGSVKVSPPSTALEKHPDYSGAVTPPNLKLQTHAQLKVTTGLDVVSSNTNHQDPESSSARAPNNINDRQTEHRI